MGKGRIIDEKEENNHYQERRIEDVVGQSEKKSEIQDCQCRKQKEGKKEFPGEKGKAGRGSFLDVRKNDRIKFIGGKNKKSNTGHMESINSAVNRQEIEVGKFSASR
jgi:hypothetical protein